MANNLEYIAKYQKEHTKQYRFNCHKVYDNDIIAKLNSVPKKATYIKKLIREDIMRGVESDNAERN